MQFSNVEEILDYAIEREEMTAKMYHDLATTVERPGMKEAFLEFAAEEGRHKARLMKIKAGDMPAVSYEKVANLEIGEHLVQPEISKNMNFQEVLAFAIKSEKVAYDLYIRLAAASTDAGLADVFRSLAQEEAKHKLRFEQEYEDKVLEGV